MNKDILLCGVGGQGTVLASRLIASAAMDCGETVHSAETIGMAQRGGSVTSHIRVGENAFSPLIPKGSADLILAFEPAEALRNLPYLKEDGIVIVNRIPVKPTTEALTDTGYDGKAELAFLQKRCRCLIVDSEQLCAPLGSTKFFNITLLGVAAGCGCLGIPSEIMLKEIAETVPKKYREPNRKAFLTGMDAGKTNETE